MKCYFIFVDFKFLEVVNFCIPGWKMLIFFNNKIRCPHLPTQSAIPFLRIHRNKKKIVIWNVEREEQYDTIQTIITNKKIFFYIIELMLSYFLQLLGSNGDDGMYQFSCLCQMHPVCTVSVMLANTHLCFMRLNKPLAIICKHSNHFKPFELFLTNHPFNSTFG